MTTKASEAPYGRYAFLNPYNLTLFFGLVAGGIVTGHHWIAILACAAEAMWLIFAPDSTLLRKVWFDPAFARAEREWAAERAKKKVAQLTPGGRTRLTALVVQKESIERLARDNPSLAVDLLQDELAKLDALLEDFVDLSITVEGAERHAATFDFAAMRRSWHVHEQHVKSEPVGDPRREVAEKNLAVLRQRRARYDDLVRSIQVVRGQMELIEHTFRLLGDEIVTMGSPRELGGRIEELRVAVDAVRATADPSTEFEELDAFEEIEECHEEWNR